MKNAVKIVKKMQKLQKKEKIYGKKIKIDRKG